jgi:hypothetical protein
MIDRGTLAGLLEHRHRLDACCPRCDCWAEMRLAKLVARGQGARRLHVPVPCVICGDLGLLKLRPPVPTRGPGGWMEPP